MKNNLKKETKRLKNDTTKVKKSGRVYHRLNCKTTLRLTMCNRFQEITLFGRNGFEWGIIIAQRCNPAHIEKIIMFQDRRAALKEFKKYIKLY